MLLEQAHHILMHFFCLQLWILWIVLFVGKLHFQLLRFARAVWRYPLKAQHLFVVVFAKTTELILRRQTDFGRTVFILAYKLLHL